MVAKSLWLAEAGERAEGSLGTAHGEWSAFMVQSGQL